MESQNNRNTSPNRGMAAEAQVEREKAPYQLDTLSSAPLETWDFPGEQSLQDVDEATTVANHPLTEKAPRVTLSRPEGGPGFVEISGDVGGPGTNETRVDVIVVPCPGADPLQTWTYDPALESDTSSIPGDHGSKASFRIPTPWVTKDLRSHVNTARVCVYTHGKLKEGMTLESLAEDLLRQVTSLRAESSSRPIFFIAHSIGGLVVKNALVRASQSKRYLEIMEFCHGVAFFGTPHRGSSYMSMPNLKESIQDLLNLESALPASLAQQIRVNNAGLIDLHDRFVDLASELRLWSFYETQESQLSGSGAGFDEVQFGAPLVSVKSAMLQIWQEDVYAVESDHARLATFGPANRGILESYLEDFADAVNKAAELSYAHPHHPLHLRDLVNVEITGFYEDPDAPTTLPRYSSPHPGSESVSFLRLYTTKSPYRNFLKLGPERCLQDRLHKTVKRSRSRERLADRSEQDQPSKKLIKEGSGLGISAALVGLSHGAATLHVPGSDEGLPFGRRPSDAHMRPPSPDSIASVSSTVSNTGMRLATDFPDVGSSGFSAFLTDKQRAEILVKEHDMGIAGFSRPDPSRRKFMWIHLPFNNPAWVKEMFSTLEKHMGHDSSRIFDYENWEARLVQNRHSESQPAFLKATCKVLSPTDRAASPRVSGTQTGPMIQGNTPTYFFVYLPYLHFDTYRSMVRRRKLIRERYRRGRAKPVPQELAEHGSLELKMIWEYIGYDPPVNCRRTLDQFGHSSLRDTEARDDDQMLYKLTRKDPEPIDLENTKSASNPSTDTLRNKKSVESGLHSQYMGSRSKLMSRMEFDIEPEDDLKDGLVLMVDQLWLWSIDTTGTPETLMTFFPRRESSPTEGTLFQQADLRNSVYNELNGDLTGRTENALDLAALIVFHAVTVLLDRSSHPDLEIFRLFDEAIGMLSERMTVYMKRFRMHALEVDDGDVNEEDDFDDSDSEGESPSAIKKRHRRELERSERENRENTSALLELRDLEDELNTLESLFITQKKAIEEMRNKYVEKYNEVTKYGQEYLNEALEYLQEYLETTDEMKKRVQATRTDYEKMLELVQRQAQVDEVRWSRLQAELASSQNLSVMIFTTYTVIFLPLTFFTGLFGMNTIEWQDENIPSLKKIGAISLPASVALIILSLVAAFNWRVQKTVKVAFKRTKMAWKKTKRFYQEKLEPESRKEARRKRREEKRRKLHEMRMSGDSDQAYDFWAMLRRQQRNMQHQIPEVNRHHRPRGE